MASVVGNAGQAFFSGSKSQDSLSEDPAKAKEAILKLEASYLSEGATVPQLQNFINGEYGCPPGNEYIDVMNPAIGAVTCRVGRSDKRTVDHAVAAAKTAYKAWHTTTTGERAAILFKIAEGIRENLEHLARLESCDVGKPLRLAKAVDIPRAAENFDFFARKILTDETASHAMPDAVNLTQRTPVGVAALITPWNLPLYLLTWKVAPALACGNTVVIKPSEMTPLTACALSEIVTKAGVPPGVFNIVHG